MRRLTFLLFFLSGTLALLYEVIWLRLLVLILGSTQFAVTAVLTAFMTGLALGSFLAGRAVNSLRWHPLRVYAALELGVGALALAVPFLLDAFSSARLANGSFTALLVLLPPTTLMGATLPVLMRLVTRGTNDVGAAAGSLYAANTAGAVVGTAVTGFLLIPWLGVSRSILLAALGNLILAVVAAVAAGRVPLEARDLPPIVRDKRGRGRSPITAGRGVRWAALAAIAASGMLALVYEIVWTRVLVLILGSSVYAFTAMLATFLVGLAAGAALGARIARALPTPHLQLRTLAAAIAAAAVAGYATLTVFPMLPSLFARTFNALDLAAPASADAIWRIVGLVAVEFLFAFLVMFPATVCMGVAFPLAVRLWAHRADEAGRAVGTVYAVNTAGSIAGAALGGFVLVPQAGLQGSLLTTVAGGLSVATALAWWLPDWRVPKRIAATAVAVLVAGIMMASRPAWDPLVMNSGIYQYAPDLRDVILDASNFSALTHDDVDVLYYEEGLTANVVVGRRPSTGNVWLSVNGKIDASSKTDLETQLLLAHLPMLLGHAAAPEGKRVAVIGYATGITTGAVTRHNPARVDAVEIEAAVLRASSFFESFNYKALADPRVRPVEADGRSYLRAQPGSYDVIISEPSSPWMTMAANLFTREYFETGRARLAPGGIFCQWIQLYGLPEDDLRSLIRTFTTVFPSVALFWGIPGQDLIVLGAESPIALDVAKIGAALENPEVAADAGRIAVRRVEDLLAHYLLDDAAVRAFAGEAPLNTDDNALIEFRAPLTMHNWAETQQANARTLRGLAVDPLAHVRGLPSEPSAKAEAYARLADAFASRRMAGRAVEAMQHAQHLAPSPERARRLAHFEEAEEPASRPR